MANTPTRPGYDRWGSRRARALKFVRDNGISGVIGKIRETGIRNASEFVARHLRYSVCIYLGNRWDRKNKVDTCGQIELFSLDVVGPNRDLGSAAVSTSPRTFAFLSRYFPSNRSDFSYIDVGSGKGRTLLLASDYGFRRVVGVEFAEALCSIALRNVEAYRAASSKRSIEVVHADATQFDLPPGNLLIYF